MSKGPSQTIIMKLPGTIRILVVSALASSLAAFGAEAKLPSAEDFSKGTLEESVDARPQVLWQWMNGHISKEGITADLEAMSKNGISGAIMYALGMETQGPVGFLSDEWFDLFLHSAREAKRCGMTIGVHQGVGWSASGGPWITPANSMQILTTSRVYVEGNGKQQVLALPKPWSQLDYYRDEMVIAYPAGPVMTDAKPVITASSPIDAALLTDGRPDTAAILPPVGPEVERFIQLEFPEPFTAESLWLTHFAYPPVGGGEVQVSDDGKSFRTLGTFEYEPSSHFKGGQTQVTFAPATGRYFRVKFKLPGGEFRIGELELGRVPMLNDLLPKAGYLTPWSIPNIVSFSYTWGATRPDGPVVNSKQVVDLTASMDAEGNLKWTPPAGRWAVLRVGHTSNGKTGEPGPTDVTRLESDKLSKAATKVHYDGYVGRLVKLCGPLTGTTFTEAVNDSWEMGPQNWTAGLQNEFRRRRGYDITPFMPLLLTGRVVDSVEISERFLQDFRQTLQELILDYYFGYFTELCHKDGLRYWNQNYYSMYCDTLDIAGKVDVPWAEFWSNYAPDTFLSENHWYAKHASSGSQVYGSPLVPAEAFTAHLDRWSLCPKYLKNKGDVIYCAGVNLFTLHLYTHQPWLDRVPGMTRGPNGIMIDRNNTWWEMGAEWMKYLTRCQAVLQQGPVVGDVIYLMPEFEPKATSAVLDAYYKVNLPRGLDYVFVSQSGLLQKAQVGEGRINFPMGVGYRMVVLPDTAVSSPEMLKKIRAMLEAGITVHATQRPGRGSGLFNRAVKDKEIQDLAADIWGDVDGKQVTSRRVGKGLLIQGIEVPAALKLAGIEPDFDFVNADASPIAAYDAKGNVRQLNSIHRKADGADVYFVANHSPQPQKLVCRFRVSGMVPERWLPATGEVERLAAWRESGGITDVPLNFAPYESAFLIFRPSKEADPVMSVKWDGRELFRDFTPPGSAPPQAGMPDWSLTKDVSGKLVLKTTSAGNFTATTAAGKSWTAKIPALPASQMVGGPWQVAFQEKRGVPATATFPDLISWSDHPDEGIRFFSGTATYQNKLAVPPEFLQAGRRVLLNLGRVEVIAQVKINGKDCGILWYDPYQMDVTDALKPGENSIEIRVANVWYNRIIGDLRHPEKPPITFCQTQWFTAADELLAGGLLGPVTLQVKADAALAPEP